MDHKKQDSKGNHPKPDSNHKQQSVNASREIEGQVDWKNLDSIPLTRKNILQMQRVLGNHRTSQIIQQRQNGDNAQRQPLPIQPLSGNHVQRNNPPRPVERIQDPEDTTTDKVKEVGDTVLEPMGLISDFIGGDQKQGMNQLGGENGTNNWTSGMGQDKVGNSGGIITNTMGLVSGGYSAYKNYQTRKDVMPKVQEYRQRFKVGDGSGPEKDIYASMELVNRQKAAAEKGLAEDSASIVGSILGIISGAAGLASAQVLGAVTSIAGGVLGIITGTISALRDFASAIKRSKAKKKVEGLLAAYMGVADDATSQKEQTQQEMTQINQTITQLQSQFDTTDNEVKALEGKIQEKETEKNKKETKETRKKELDKEIETLNSQIETKSQTLKSLTEQKETEGNKLPPLTTKVGKLEQTMDKFYTRGRALAVAARKQGYKTKIVSGGIGTLSVASGALLLAAMLGASAALGPVGWAIAGVAILAGIGLAVGMKVKKAIRESNVVRMKDEKAMVDDYVNNGNLPSGITTAMFKGFQDKKQKGSAPNTPVPGTDQSAVDQRKAQTWHRGIFPVAEEKKKGWFNRLISKKRSGTMTMAERQKHLTDYIGKYDTGAAGDTIVTGFIEVLRDENSEDGQRPVQNPAFDENKPESDTNKKTVPAYNLHMGMLAHFFGDNAEAMRLSLLSPDDDKAFNAATLLKKKLKVE